MPSTATPDSKTLDVQYKPFPRFVEWLGQTSIDTARWERQVSLHARVQGQSDAILKRARTIATRAAAIDTGAIEGLYEVDRGFTFTVAYESAAWEAAVAAKGEQFRVLFESQLRAYDYVLDFATGAQPIVEAFVRTLHEQICESQDTYSVVTEVGPQNHPLPKGQYKVHPNHVRKQDGRTHSYAPVDLTPAEMHRLISELRSDAFQNAHVVQQAAYAHFAFVAIHPFADGNGRVARALASVFTYRHQSVPLVILVEHRPDYYAALSAADTGNFQSFVDFVFARTLESVQFVDDSVRTAIVPSAVDTVAEIKALYVTPSGYTHQEVDTAGKRLLQELQTELTKFLAPFQSEQLQFTVSRGTFQTVSHAEGFRGVVGNAELVNVTVVSKAPAHAQISVNIALSVPRVTEKDDDIVLWPVTMDEPFLAPISGCLPNVSAAVQMRLRMYAERLVATILVQVKTAASKSLRQSGYG